MLMPHMLKFTLVCSYVLEAGNSCSDNNRDNWTVVNKTRNRKGSQTFILVTRKCPRHSKTIRLEQGHPAEPQRSRDEGPGCRPIAKGLLGHIF